MPIAVPTFSPPTRLGVAHLRAAFVGILTELEPIVRIPRAVVGRVISIEERIAEIRRLIAERPFVSFAEILRGRGNRQEVIVNFLALLELVKQRVIRVEQEGRAGVIAVVRLPISGYAEAVTTNH
jgi:segregation and condensation protein A